jgi:hypothetical protein
MQQKAIEKEIKKTFNQNWKKERVEKQATRITRSLIKGCIHNWGTKKEWLVFKGLQRITLDFCLFYIIIVVMDCCMPIDKMMSY